MTFQAGAALGRVVFVLFITGLAVTLGVFGWQKIQDPAFAPIRHVQVQAEYHHVTGPIVTAVLTPLLDKNMLLLNTTTIKNQLLNLPWIATADVKRVWPDVLQVKISEQHPVALWNDNGVVNSLGTLFYPEKTSLPNNLPHFSGPDGQSQVVLDYYHEMAPILKTIGQQISNIELSSRRAWEVVLENGTRLLLGRDDVFDRLKRFTKIYSEIPIEKQQQIVYIDLRYADGAAIRFRGDNNK